MSEKRILKPIVSMMQKQKQKKYCLKEEEEENKIILWTWLPTLLFGFPIISMTGPSLMNIFNTTPFFVARTDHYWPG